ncbi:MAG: GPW/gp25 family protein [Dehalococcoidia bacterium]|nr:GPW/gp25 family protein [Dehalococcoidia bacterium]
MTDNPLIGRGWAFPVLPNGSGGIAMADGTQDIDQAIVLVLSTSPGERVMRPNFGCRIHELVFAPLTADTVGLARRYVEEALGWWEPRIEVRDIIVEPDLSDAARGRLNVSIRYSIRATKDERTLVYPFYLIREE